MGKNAAVEQPSSLRWWLLVMLSVLMLAAVYAVAVLTPAGQAFENAALRGADQVDPLSESDASKALAEITVWSLAAAAAAVGVIGLLRRQPLLAAIAVGVIVGGQVVTQSLKRFILPRPELVPVVGDYTGNSFPSGHATIAMTVLVAVFLVVPYRWRGVAMLVVMTWATGIGTYTLTAKWHRLSDTLGADLVALALGGAAALILMRVGRMRRVGGRAFPGRVVLVMLSSAAAATITALGLFLAMSAVGQDLRDPVVEWNVYLAATCLAFGGSLLAGLVHWGFWHRLEVAPPAR